MKARQEAKAIRDAQREAHNRRQYKKAKADWYSFGGTLEWGYKKQPSAMEFLLFRFGASRKVNTKKAQMIPLVMMMMIRGTVTLTRPSSLFFVGGRGGFEWA